MALRPARFLIWGAGGHGKVVGDLVQSLGHAVVGFVDRDDCMVGRATGRTALRVVASESDLLACIDRHDALPAGADYIALAIGSNEARARCLERLPGALLPALIHESAIVSPSACIGHGSIILPRSVINADATIGRGVIINTAAIIEHDCTIGDAAHVSPGAVLAGGVRVGARGWIGAGAVVINAVSVGEDATVGAGAVVLRDIPPRITVAGVPARNLGS